MIELQLLEYLLEELCPPSIVVVTIVEKAPIERTRYIKPGYYIGQVIRP